MNEERKSIDFKNYKRVDSSLVSSKSKKVEKVKNQDEDKIILRRSSRKSRGQSRPQTVGDSFMSNASDIMKEMMEKMDSSDEEINLSDICT